jgi:hypothetical protein
VHLRRLLAGAVVAAQRQETHGHAVSDDAQAEPETARQPPAGQDAEQGDGQEDRGQAHVVSLLKSSELCGNLPSMGARRTEKISAVLTPELAARLSEFASRHRWSLSTAVEQLVEQGVSADEIERSARYHQHALYQLRSREIRERSMEMAEDD